MSTPVRILFHSLKSFFNFTDIYEYATILAGNKRFSVYYLGTDQTGRDFKEKNVKVYHLSREPGDKIKRLKFALKQILEKEEIDIVHVFHYRGSGLLPLEYFFRKEPIWVIDIRTIHVEDRSGKTTNRYKGFLKDKLTWIETISYDYKLALTEVIRRRMYPSFREIEILPLGVNEEKFKISNRRSLRKITREKLNVPEKGILLIYSGSLSPSRNIDVLFKAVSDAMSKDDRIYLVVLGDYLSKNYLDHLKLNFDKNNIECVQFLGLLPYPEIPAYYLASDIGLSYTPRKSPYALQPPTKILEYMMAGLITVTNRTIETDKLIAHRQSGVLTNDDVPSISDGINIAIQMLHDPDSVMKESYTVASKYTWDKIVNNKLIPFYRQLIDPNRR